MKFLSLRSILITIVLLLLEFSVAYANETLQYELTAEKVEKAWLSETSNGFYVVVKLSEPYRKDFAELTGNNIGRKLEIILSGEIFTAARIQARIESGSMHSYELESIEDAERLLKMLLPGSGNN